ncbi:MAG TPA: TonB-dependent receptor, partial [Acidobacteriaceae bacterium]|nr:TonB-dependent receptor [Acidobacteriaceae bacterium]
PYFGEPQTSTPGPLTYGCGQLGDSNGQARLSSTLLLGDTMTVVKGAHSIKFGGEFRNVKDTNYDDFFSREGLSLNNFTDFSAPSYVYNGPADSPNLLPFEDLVWGPTGAIANSLQNQFFTRTGARQANDLTRFVQREWAIFGQDTWKITPRFTAILGLRYEFNGVPFERDGNFANFFGDGTTAAPPQGFEFTLVGPGNGQQLYSNSWNLVEPRIGFAWDPKGDGRTAIRGGFGTFHDRIFDNIFGNAKSNPPFQAQSNLFPFDGTTTTPLVSNTPPPGTLTPSAFVIDGDFLEPVVIDPHLKIPGTQSWNLGVQRQIDDHLTAELNYVGSHTVHALREIDGAPPQPALVQQLINQGVPTSALQETALYTGGQYTDSSGNTVMFGPAVNNQAFFHILFQTAEVNGNYNALQFRMTEQVGGLSLTGSYTFAHSLDNGSDTLVQGAGGAGLPRSSFHLADEYGNSDSDVRQRFVAAGTYALPIGHGQHYLSSGFLGRALEGMQISGIQQAQTGLPFELRGTVDNLHSGVLNRPQLVGKPYPSNRGQKVAGGGVITGPALSAFANAPFDQDLSIRRNAFHGPGFVNTDAVFQKTQTLHESVKMVLRVESYNLLNHPNFESPSGLSIADPTFGQSTAQVGQNDGTTGARQLQGAVKIVF